MDLRTFERKFRELKRRGYIPTQRSGNTGVGHTLESELGLSENNVALSDMAVAELKAHRQGSSSLITLFTLDRGAWQVDQMKTIHDYGLIDTEGRPNLYMTLAAGQGGTSLRVEVDSVNATVSHPSGTVVAQWKHTDLAERFEQKFPALMLVSADVEVRNGKEWFHYKRAQLLQGTSGKRFQLGMSNGWIKIDLRLHDNGGAVRNHGTGFRISEDKLPQLFESISDI
ncbi:MAG: MvaI/BcnI family restriction endonuclease [Ilumatobacteraceae bacterium]